MIRLMIIPAAVLTLFTAVAGQAAVLKGVVLAEELGGPPAAGVEIDPTEGAKPVVADAGGAFTLVFPDKQAGDTVLLTVRSEGREVVNDFELEQVLVDEPQGSPVVLLLCQAGNRDEMRRRLVLLLVVKAIGEHYQRRLKAIEDHSENALEGLLELRRWLYEAEAALATIPATLVKLWDEGFSGPCRQAMRLFLEGQLDRALEVLEKRDSGPAQADFDQNATADRDSPEAVSRHYQLKGCLLTLALQMKEADTAFQAALRATPDDFEANLRYAFFLSSTNRGDEAGTRTLRSLEIAKKAADSSQIGQAWLQLAVVHQMGKRMREAGLAFEEAVKIYRELVNQDRAHYLPELAAALTRLATFLREQGNLAEAGKVKAEILGIYRGLAEGNPQAYSVALAMTLNRLADVQRGRTAAKRPGGRSRRPSYSIRPWQLAMPSDISPMWLWSWKI